MSRKYLIVVDMQEDFVYGALGSPEAREIVPAVVEMVKGFDGTVLFTKDTHQNNYLDTQEGKFLPVPHCINLTKGWELIEPLELIQQEKQYPVYVKGTFGCTNLAMDLHAEHSKQEIESIELIGVCIQCAAVKSISAGGAYHRTHRLLRRSYPSKTRSSFRNHEKLSNHGQIGKRSLRKSFERAD